MNADMLIESARTWERDWGERRTSGLITALADLAEQQACRLAAIDAAVPISAARIKARLDGGTAGDNTLQAVHDIKELLAIVGQQAADLAAANASILKLRAEVEEQRGRAEDAERHCSELTTARNKQDEARALACYQRDEALAELARLKGQEQ